MKRLIMFALPRSRRFTSALFVAFVQGLSAVALMGCSAWLISRAAQQPPIMYLSIAIVGVRTFALARASLRYAERWLSHDAVLRDSAKRRVDVFESLIDFVPAGLQQDSIADLSARTTLDVEESQNLGLRVVNPLVQSIAVSLISVVVFWFFLPEGAIVMALALAAAFLIAIPLSAAVARKADANQAGLRSLLATQTSELLNNQDLLLAYEWHAHRVIEIEQIQERISRGARWQAIAFGAGQAAFSFLAAATAIASAVFGAQSISESNSDPVMLAVYALLPLAVFDVASASQGVVGSWRRYRSSATRLLEVSERSLPTELQFGEGETLTKLKSLELKDVSLGYPGALPVIQGISLKLRAGETAALVGQSGSGKTTIGLALARLLKPRSGELVLNGRSADEFDSDSIRRRMGYLEQNPAIFNSSVRVNLAIAQPSASDEQMISVLSQVGLWEMFARREGLDTLVGDRGALISGGEAQRLALARALLADFDFIVLDEPTANVDELQSKQLVSDLLKAAKSKDRMVLLITHDAKLAKLAHKKIEI